MNLFSINIHIAIWSVSQLCTKLRFRWPLSYSRCLFLLCSGVCFVLVVGGLPPVTKDHNFACFMMKLKVWFGLVLDLASKQPQRPPGSCAVIVAIQTKPNHAISMSSGGVYCIFTLVSNFFDCWPAGRLLGDILLVLRDFWWPLASGRALILTTAYLPFTSDFSQLFSMCEKFSHFRQKM